MYIPVPILRLCSHMAELSHLSHSCHILKATFLIASKCHSSRLYSSHSIHHTTCSYQSHFLDTFCPRMPKLPHPFRMHNTITTRNKCPQDRTKTSLQVSHVHHHLYATQILFMSLLTHLYHTQNAFTTHNKCPQHRKVLVTRFTTSLHPPTLARQISCLYTTSVQPFQGLHIFTHA